MGMNILGVAGLGVCAMALILGCIGCGLPYQGEGSITVLGFKVDIYTGLWYRCLEPETNLVADNCGSIDLDEDCKKTFHCIMLAFIKNDAVFPITCTLIIW